jgi:hypothetical protein
MRIHQRQVSADQRYDLIVCQKRRAKNMHDATAGPEGARAASAIEAADAQGTFVHSFDATC